MAAWWMLSWELLAQNRRLFGITGIYLVAICLVYPFLPALFHSPDVAMLLTLPPYGVLAVLIAALSHGYHGELEARASAFPARLFTLPVSSLTLVGPSLVLGTLVCVLGWTILTLGVLRTIGEGVPLWPGVMAAALLAWVQALSWLPFPLRWLRLITMAVVLPVLGVTAILLGSLSGSATLLVLLFLALTAIAYLVAFTGVRLARQGVGVREPVREAAASTEDKGERYTPFISAAQAQLWLEWRLHGQMGLFGLLLSLVWVVPAVHMTSIGLRNETLLEVLPHVKAAVESVGIGWLAVTQLLLMPAMFALVGGADMGRFTSRRAGEASPFVLTRPIDTTALVRAKMLLAALGALLAWLLMVFVAALWAAVTGHWLDMADRLTAATGSWPLALAALAGGLVLGTVVTWLVMMRSLWLGLLGGRHLNWIPAMEGVLLGVLIWLAGRGWLEYPVLRPWLVLLLVVALLLKAGAAGWIGYRLHRGHLAGATTLLVCGLGWLLVAGVTAGLVCGVSGGGAVLFAIVLLLMPLAGPLAAPLALAWARHR